MGPLELIWKTFLGPLEQGNMYAAGVMCTIRFTFAGDKTHWVSLARTGRDPDTYHGRDHRDREVVMVFEEKSRWDLERQAWVSV